MNHPMLLVGVLTSVAGLAAQTTVVSPAVFTNLPAPSANTHPLGAATPGSTTMRYMGIHDDMAGKVGVIKGLSFRLNEGSLSYATTITMEVRISTAASLAAAASATYDLNHGSDKITAVPASTPFNLPAWPATAPGPTPFVYSVPFNNVFVFIGSAGIAWETLIASRTNTAAFSLDAGSATAFNFVGASFGAGCIATGRTVAATSSSSYSAGAVTLTASGLTGTAPGALVLGASTALWNGIPLPFDLPGTTGYPSGTCRVYCDWLVALPLTSNSTGLLTQGLPFTVGAGTLGISFYHYGFTLDAVANGFGAVTSNARLDAFGNGAVLGGCRIYSYNDVNAVSGSKDTTIVVVGFQY